MNSATPLYGHPSACRGIILEEGHLRTLKVTALWVVDVDTRDKWGKESVMSLYIVSAVLALVQIHGDTGVSVSKVLSKYLDSSSVFTPLYYTKFQMKQ